jgi:uracil DNA glycosylase
VRRPGGPALEQFIEGRPADGAVIYAARPLRVPQATSLRETEVVRSGQGPYRGPGLAEATRFLGAPRPIMKKCVLAYLKLVAGQARPIMLLLWGAQAQAKAGRIESNEGRQRSAALL